MEANAPGPDFKDEGLLQSVRAFPLEKMGQLWYRGQSSVTWSLRPGILRRIPKFGLVPVVQYENSLYREFRRGAMRFVDPSLRRSLVEIYLQAQHSGLPTRLLDWTTNPLAALFFAVDATDDSDGDDATLFALDLAHVSGLASEESPRLTACLEALFGDAPAFEGSREWLAQDDPTCPMPVEPNVRYGRMAQQSSRFTFHFNVDAWPRGALRRWTVPKGAKRGILYDLDSLNVTRATLFPDIDNLAHHLRHGVDPALRSIVFGESLDGGPRGGASV